MSIASKVIGLLGGVFNLFAKGGTTGGIVVRKPGGTPGTQEAGIYCDGVNLLCTKNVAIGTTGGVGGFAGFLGDYGSFGTYLAAGINGISIGNIGNAVGLGSGSSIAWCAGTVGNGTPDTSFFKIAPGVIGAGTGLGTGKAFVQNSAGRARLTADVTESAGTLTNLADLSITLIAGRKYTGRLVLKCVNSVAADGVQIDANGGTATATSFWAAAGVLASNGTDTVGTNIATALNGVMNFTVLTGETVIVVEFSIVCNAAGTLIFRAAENAHTTGTLTVRLGSYLWAEDSPN